jgi:hypothetical protein
MPPGVFAHHTCLMLSHPHLHTPYLHQIMPPGVFTNHMCLMLSHPHLHISYLHHIMPHGVFTNHTCLMLSHPHLHTPSLHHIMPPQCPHVPHMHHIMPPTLSHILPASHHAVPLSSDPCLHSPAHCSVHTVHHWQTRLLQMARKSRLSSKRTGTGNRQSVSWTQVVPKIQHIIDLTVNLPAIIFHSSYQNIWTAMSV